MSKPFDHLNGVMFDIETLGRTVGSAILSIGACRFNISENRVYDEFYVTIKAKDSLSKGFTYEKETLTWWQDNPQALKEAQVGAMSVEDGLNEFYTYLKKRKKEPLWAWGPHFDVPMVEYGMLKVLNLTVDTLPWKYYNVRDARTVLDVFGDPINREEGTHHNAKDDAVAQAKYLVDFFRRMDSEYLDDDIPF